MLNDILDALQGQHSGLLARARYDENAEKNKGSKSLVLGRTAKTVTAQVSLQNYSMP
jgi:hypothetical protein